MADSIPGTRPGTERSITKQYSAASLEQKPAAAKAHQKLLKATWKADDLFKAGEGDAVPCLQDPEFFTGDDLPTDRDGQMACAKCPKAVYDACEIYRLVAHPAHGVWAGVVKGRELQELMKEEEEA